MGNDKSIRIWNADSGICEKILLGHDGGVLYGVFSIDGRRVLSYSQDGTIRVWDVDPKSTSYSKCLKIIEIEEIFNSAAFSYDRRYIVSSSVYEVFIWNADTGVLINKMKFKSLVQQVLFSNNGYYIAIALKGKIIIKNINDLLIIAGGKKNMINIKKKSKKLIDTFKKYDLVKIAKNYEISLKTRDNKSKTKLQLFNSLKRKKLI